MPLVYENLAAWGRHLACSLGSHLASPRGASQPGCANHDAPWGRNLPGTDWILVDHRSRDSSLLYGCIRPAPHTDAESHADAAPHTASRYRDDQTHNSDSWSYGRREQIYRKVPPTNL